MLMGSAFVILMQIGFALVESAQVRPKNRQTLLTKNVVSFLAGLFIFFLIGYAFAFGGSTLGLIGGRSEYAGKFSPDWSFHERKFTYFFACSIIVSTIVTGALAEKARLPCMVGFAILNETLIFPMVACWAWGEGWVSNLENFFDRSGTIVIFWNAGISALVATIVLGPRYGKFMRQEMLDKVRGGGKHERKKNLQKQLDDLKEDSLDIDELYLMKIRSLIKKECEEENFNLVNIPCMVIGTILLTTGWAMLNAIGGSQLQLSNTASRYSAELAFMNTFVAMCPAGLVGFTLKRFITGLNKELPRYDVRSLCNAMLCALASVSASAGIIKPWAALVIGGLAGCWYCVFCLVFHRIKWEDPLESFQVYGIGGLWGSIAGPLFNYQHGLVSGLKSSGKLFGYELIAMVAVAAISALCSWIYFFVWHKLDAARLSKAEEIIGMDAIEAAHAKQVDLKPLMEAIDKLYPDNPRKGC